MSESIAPHIKRITNYGNLAVIEQMLHDFDAQEIAVHGIKNELSAYRVAKEGVAPNCPDVSPPGSFWTSGRRIFFSGNPSEPVSTYDTSFFHYAHAESVREDTVTMSAALTTRQALRDTVADWDDREFDSGYFALRQVLPPNKLHLVLVQGERLGTTDAPYVDSRLIECKMIGMLANVGANGIELGAHTFDQVTESHAYSLS